MPLNVKYGSLESNLFLFILTSWILGWRGRRVGFYFSSIKGPTIVPSRKPSFLTDLKENYCDYIFIEPWGTFRQNSTTSFTESLWVFESKRQEVKASEDRTDGIDEDGYSKESLSVDLQHTYYFKWLRQKISHACHTKMQVVCFTQHVANHLSFTRSRKHVQKQKFLLS